MRANEGRHVGDFTEPRARSCGGPFTKRAAFSLAGFIRTLHSLASVPSSDYASAVLPYSSKPVTLIPRSEACARSARILKPIQSAQTARLIFQARGRHAVATVIFALIKRLVGDRQQPIAGH